ncbi:ATPase [Aureococcus anophagefferens]|nr:ATPase [Aureococcus anophagefferens]
MRTILLALLPAAAYGAASDCEFRREAGWTDFDEEFEDGHTYMWLGLSRDDGCADLHCDAATGRAMKQREERFMWRERRRENWQDVGPAVPASETTEVLVASDWGADQYASCLYDYCETTCDALAARDAGTADAAAYDDLFSRLTTGTENIDAAPKSCFDDDDDWWWYFGWITTAHAFWILNALRNEFADSCPCLHRWLTFCCVRCCVWFSSACACCACCCGRKKDARTADDAAPSEAADARDLELVVTMQPEAGDAAAGPVAASTRARGAALEARSAGPQFKLLLWKIATVKKRDGAGLFKQLLCPALTFAVIWMLYVTAGITGMSPSARWNKNNMNYARKDGEMHDYDKGQFLSHGMLELFLGFLGFIPFVQVVAVSIVNEHQAKLVEAMKMAGLRPPVYWLANFVAEGVACGGVAALLVAVVAARREDRLGESVVSTSIWTKSVAIQRWYALNPQWAYQLIVHSFMSNRAKHCRVTASLAGVEDFASHAYECTWRDMNVDDAKSDAKRELAAWLVDAGAYCANQVYDYSYSYEDPGAAEGLAEAACAVSGPFSKHRSFYSKSDEGPWWPRPQWTGSLFGMLLLDIVLFLVLAWYFSQCVPWSEYGTPKPWYFPLQPSYWCAKKPKEEVTDEEEAHDPAAGFPEAYEPLGGGKAAVVRVRNLRKTFGDFRAVDGVSFDMVESEIFCLLGHNGAGKTTTISMLSGLTPPDRTAAGAPPAAAVYGFDVGDADAMRDLRRNLGVCPQHDILFQHLTLEEHVAFFGRLKGKSKDAAERDAAALLRVFHLGDRSHHLGSELSGGQKRKLSVSIALSGHSKFVVLDEPTAGMDPVARREFWTLLRSVRLRRALLLTTHHMDEAEALGDRVAIMASGKVKADGSIDFLKRRFGSGYRLAFRCGDRAAAERAVLEAVPGATAEDLTEAAHLGIHDAANAARFERLRAVSPLLGAADRAEVEADALAFDVAFGDRDRLPALFDALRNLEKPPTDVAFSSTTLEDVFLAVGEDQAVHNITKVNSQRSSYDLYAEAAADDGVADEPRGWSLGRHLGAVAGLRLRLARNDCAVLLWPLMVVEAAAAALAKPARSPRTSLPPLAALRAKYVGGGRAPVVCLVPALTSLVLCALMQRGKLVVGKNPRWSELPNVLVAVGLGLVWMLVPGLLAEPIVRERKLRLRNLLAVSGLDVRAYWLGSVLGDALPLALGVGVAWLALGAYHISYRVEQQTPKMVLNGTRYDYFCDPASGYWDDDFCQDESFDRREWLETSWLFAVYPCFVLALLGFAHFGSYAFADPNVCVGAFPVIVLGLVVVPLILVIFLALAFGGLMPGGDASQLFTWNYAEMIAAYAWLETLVNPVGGLLVALLRVTRMSFVVTKSMEEAWSPTWPPYWATCAIFLAQFVGFEALAYVKDRLATRPLPYAVAPRRKREAALDDDVAAERARVLALFADAGSAAPPAPDADGKAGYAARAVAAAAAVRAELTDELASDALAPPAVAETAEACDRDGLLVREVRKIFPPKRLGQRAIEAVQNVTFGVRSGEVFGLLGANGAGKTTTMAVVTRALEPTSGDAAIGGRSVLDDFGAASKRLGLVNQHNTLWDALSCRDHLRLFAGLRGSGAAGAGVVDATLDRVELLAHGDKPAGRLSGGMKRKLCCAAALVGDPRIVLLDEPSAGLDPVSQRNLWNLIKSTMAGRAVVLTTHSMVEADVLCDRIAIQVAGQLHCLGTPAHLKAKYASGYELVVKVDEARSKTSQDDADAAAAVSAFAAERLGATEVSADAGTLTYELPPRPGAELLADAFAAFDGDRRAELRVAEFAVVQASLEKVFIRIVAGESGDIHEQSSLGRRVAGDLQADDDDAESDVDDFVFAEPTCCRCSRFAHNTLAKYHASCCCVMSVYQILGSIGAPWIVFNTGLLTIAFHLFSAITNCVGVCCIQAPPKDA